MPDELTPFLSAATWDEFLTALTAEMEDARKYLRLHAVTFACFVLGVGMMILSACMGMHTPVGSWLWVVGFTNVWLFMAVWTPGLFCCTQYRMIVAQKKMCKAWQPKFAQAGLTLTTTKQNPLVARACGRSTDDGLIVGIPAAYQSRAAQAVNAV